jgi:FkbM family methyltransferase
MMQGVRQNDSRLVEYIHGSQLFSPNLITKELNDSSQRSLSEIQQQLTRDVIKVLQEKVRQRFSLRFKKEKKHYILFQRNGFFVECRAFSDEYSKTLALELKYNWTGILLEPDPYLFPKLRANNRNAWLLNACLSPDPIAHNVDFLRKFIQESSNDSISNEQLLKKSLYRDSKGQLWKKLQIPCFPLFSITSALRVNNIDFLILDTQGLELQILVNIPWAFININVGS